MKQDFVLAVIIETNGSTYRKAGAMMLIESDYQYWGLLSGGCLEGDILLQSKSVFTSKKDQLVHYNMRDEADLLWGMGLGCDGELTVLLKYLPMDNNHCGFIEALHAVISGSNCSMILDLGLCSAPSSVSVSDSNSSQLDSVDIKYEFGKSALADYQLKNNSANIQSKTIFIESPHRLLICGGSPDIVPVVAIASEIGWHVTVIDHRADYSDATKFPRANQVKQIKRSKVNNIDLSYYDSALIMSHQFEMDKLYLSKLQKSEIEYIGLLGPRIRRDKLLQECGIEFEQQEGRIFGPVGLDIGAGKPETIALAIVSEIQAVKNNKHVNGSISFCYQDEAR